MYLKSVAYIFYCTWKKKKKKNMEKFEWMKEIS